MAEENLNVFTLSAYNIVLKDKSGHVCRKADLIAQKLKAIVFLFTDDVLVQHHFKKPPWYPE